MVAEATFVNRTLEGAKWHAFLCQKERVLSYINSFLHHGQHAGTYKDMVEVAPLLSEKVSAFGLQSFLSPLRHKRRHSLVDVAEDFIVWFGIEVTHQHNIFACQFVEQTT